MEARTLLVRQGRGGGDDGDGRGRGGGDGGRGGGRRGGGDRGRGGGGGGGGGGGFGGRGGNGGGGFGGGGGGGASPDPVTVTVASPTTLEPSLIPVTVTVATPTTVPTTIVPFSTIVPTIDPTTLLPVPATTLRSILTSTVVSIITSIQNSPATIASTEVLTVPAPATFSDISDTTPFAVTTGGATDATSTALAAADTTQSMAWVAAPVVGSVAAVAVVGVAFFLWGRRRSGQAGRGALPKPKALGTGVFARLATPPQSRGGVSASGSGDSAVGAVSMAEEPRREPIRFGNEWRIGESRRNLSVSSRRSAPEEASIRGHARKATLEAPVMHKPSASR